MRADLIAELRQKIKSGNYEVQLQILTRRIFDLIKSDLRPGHRQISAQTQ